MSTVEITNQSQIESTSITVRSVMRRTRFTKAEKKAIGRLIVKVWKRAATKIALSGMTYTFDSKDYRQGIGKPNIQGNRVVVALETDRAKELSNWIESGHESIDLRKKLLANATRRDKDNNPYTIVMLAHTFSWRGSASQRIPKRFRGLINPAQNWLQSAFSYIGEEWRPGSISERPHMRWGMGVNPTSGYVHKYGKLARLHGNSDTGFRTFRTVSLKSDPGSWVIPARSPNHVIRAVADEVVREWNAMSAAGAPEDTEAEE